MGVGHRLKRKLPWSEPRLSREMYNTIATSLFFFHHSCGCSTLPIVPPPFFLSFSSSPCLNTVSPSLLPSAPLLPPLPPPIHISDSERGMANTMVSVRSSELGPLGWDAVTKRQLFLQKVSSKLGPNVRQQGRGIRMDKGPSGLTIPSGSGAELLGQGSPRQTQSEGATLREDGQKAGSGSPTRARQSQTQCQGELLWFLYVCRHINMNYFSTNTHKKPEV